MLAVGWLVPGGGSDQLAAAEVQQTTLRIDPLPSRPAGGPGGNEPAAAPASQPPAANTAQQPAAQQTDAPADGGAGADSNAILGRPEQHTPPPSVPGLPRPLPRTNAAPLLIKIDTTGYQAEIDQCLWVKMDLNAVAPIVAAHDYCGGAVVLELQPGDRVDLTGEGLDGAYVMSGERQARPGDDAPMATKGMAATVLLQTCYPDGERVRLVSLVPA